MGLTTNGIVITDADYDEDRDRLEEDQEKESGEQETTNKVFWDG